MASIADQQLDAIQASLDKGVAVDDLQVRTLLEWFGAERRGERVVERIAESLTARGLHTEPGIVYAYLDGTVKVVKTSSASPDFDDSYGIGSLPAANRPPISVTTDTAMNEVFSLMMQHDYSQLPILNGRTFKGVVTWKSISAKFAAGKPPATAKDCAQAVEPIDFKTPLFSAIAKIAEHEFVIVKKPDNTISGIVTASDLNLQFQSLAEPFLLLGEVENGIRHLLRGKFTTADLNAIKDPNDQSRIIESLADLTFGEYVRLLEEPSRWTKSKLLFDRATFIKQMGDVRDIRNDVMHFRPEGPGAAAIETLRTFARYLKKLRELQG